MGISPLVRLEREFLSPRNVIVSVKSPGQSSSQLVTPLPKNEDTSLSVDDLDWTSEIPPLSIIESKVSSPILDEVKSEIASSISVSETSEENFEDNSVSNEEEEQPIIRRRRRRSSATIDNE
jgi:hypothetical protein